VVSTRSKLTKSYKIRNAD